jgi:hypothetical protein
VVIIYFYDVVLQAGKILVPGTRFKQVSGVRFQGSEVLGFKGSVLDVNVIVAG